MDRSDSALSNRAFAPHRAVGAPPAAPTSPAPATDPAPAATVPAATVPAWPDLPAPTDIAPAYPDRVDADPDGARPAGGGPGDDRPTEGRWVRPALAGLLLATALLYLWGLGASG